MRKALCSFGVIFIMTITSLAQWNSNKSQNTVLNGAPISQQFQKICSDGAGGVIIAWWDQLGAGSLNFDVRVQRFDAQGKNVWTAEEIPLGVLSTNIGDMDIAPDGTGGAIIAFNVGFNIKAQRVSGSGALVWNSGVAIDVCTAINAQFNVQVVGHSDGSSVIVWQDERSGAAEDDVYAQRLNSAGVPQWTTNGNVISAAVQYQELPVAVSDGAGGAIVAWRDWRSGTNYDIYAQHIGSDGVRRWPTINTPTGEPISTATANQNFPKICPDGAGGAIIAWQDFRSGATNSTDIYAQGVNSSGVIQWLTHGVALCSTPNTEDISDMAFVGDGAVVVWTDRLQAGSSSDLKAQKVSRAGDVIWASNGVVVCNEAGSQNSCQVATDNSGGAVFVWADERSTFWDVYAQRFSNGGSALWANNGTLVSNAEGNQYNPYVVTSGCTSIFVWLDTRNGGETINEDIYGSSFDCNGNVVGSAVPDICDGIDNDNDGQIDEDATKVTYYQDFDGDGYGNPKVVKQLCNPVPGYVTDNTDCNDADQAIHAPVTYFKDSDGDGFGNPAAFQPFCQSKPPTGYADNSLDCDDSKATYPDQDGDGYGGDVKAPCGVDQPGDCDDASPAINPGAPEQCNNIDDNCNGLIDDGAGIKFFQDSDKDGYGNPKVAKQSCGPIPGFVANSTDCNDSDPLVHEPITYYADTDADGFGNPVVSQALCQSTPPAGYTNNSLDCDDTRRTVEDLDADGYTSGVATPCGKDPSELKDCDDNDPAINPGATEVCNGRDDDCDFAIDEEAGAKYFRDRDSDGFGNPLEPIQACEPPSGYVTDNTDCNDTDPQIHGPIIYYKDADGDGFGNAQGDMGVCPGKPAPIGFVTNSLDCDDANVTYEDKDGDDYGSAIIVPCGVLKSGDCNDGAAAINPGATEQCNGLDDNCNKLVDDGVGAIYYQDFDGDGYGNPKVVKQLCNPMPGYVTDNTDCNDADATINPGAAEACGNGVDEDCNVQIDDGCNNKLLINIHDALVYEKDGLGRNGTAYIKVSLTRESDVDVSVSYSTTDGTARSRTTRTVSKDYEATRGTLIIPAGSLSRIIEIPVIADLLTEGEETFTVQLGRPVGAGIDDGIATVTILDGAAPQTITKSTHQEVQTEAVQQLSIKAMPNPATTYFNLQLQSNSIEAVSIRILDVYGRTIEARKGVASNGTLQLGHFYRPGIYFVEVNRGVQRRLVKLIKTAD